jgi:glycosyltransferase involved in cell wall biosynthesis
VSQGKTVLALHDAAEFGGHEIMLLRFLPALLDDPRLERLDFAHAADNAELARRLDALGHAKLRRLPWGWRKRGGEPWLGRLRRGYACAVRRLHAETRPDIALIVQGRIENGVVPMRALPRDARLFSYIPMAHSLGEMGLRFAAIGDAVRRPLYARPARFIAPSASVAAQLERAGARGEVRIVRNVIDLPPAIDRAEARARLNLPGDARVALFIGRFDVGQKGLDLLLAAIARDAARLGGWTFLFVGDGEGRGAIAALAEKLRGQVEIGLRGFTSDVPTHLAAADLMLIPSRFESGPLVLLEAMAQDLPALASGIDVFQEQLPAANRTDFATASLADAMARALSPDAVAAYRAAAAERLARDTVESSAAAFVEAVLG